MFFSIVENKKQALISSTTKQQSLKRTPIKPEAWQPLEKLAATENWKDLTLDSASTNKKAMCAQDQYAK